jgi:hypothetical protein
MTQSMAAALAVAAPELRRRALEGVVAALMIYGEKVAASFVASLTAEPPTSGEGGTLCDCGHQPDVHYEGTGLCQASTGDDPCECEGVVHSGTGRTGGVR